MSLPTNPFVAPLPLLRLCLILILLLVVPKTYAVPAFARQTGSPCADCHAAAYGAIASGPNLTPHGMRFKLNGYTESDGNGVKLPLAMQLTETRADPARGQTTTRLNEADLYIAGRLTENIGGYAKVEADNTGRDGFDIKLNNFDLRFVAKDLKLGEKDLLVGVSVNNSPGFQDPIPALPAAASLGPPSISASLLNLSSIANRVVGATVYGLYDSNWYGEVGTYTSMSPSTQDHLGYRISGDPGKLSDTGYFRFAYMKDLKSQFFSAGIVALTTNRRLPRSGPADDITDLGYDLTYQYLGNREHIVQVSYVDILEQRDYGSMPPGPAPGLFAKSYGVIHDQTLSFTYVFRQTYSVTLAHLASTGSLDDVRYPPYGNPESTANMISLAWTPFGKEDSFTPFANLKIAATWFRFAKFNGRSNDIFATAPPTNAKDLDQFTLAASIAF